MPLALNLTTLPCEIRTAIFGYYFQLDGGYIFDAESEKLVDANGQPIDLSLMYTCRSIANDSRDLPFAFNAVSFSTFYSPRWRAWAGRFEYLSTLHYFLQLDLLTYLGQFITVEMYSLIENKFPGFSSMLKMRIENCKHYQKRFAKIESGTYRYGDLDSDSEDEPDGDSEGEPDGDSEDELDGDSEDEPDSDPDDQDPDGLEDNQHIPDNHEEEGSESDINSQRPSRPPQELEIVKIGGHADLYRDLMRLIWVLGAELRNYL
ncbi:hypothetical protein ACHAPJ_007511 [Fusarium lateritium]